MADTTFRYPVAAATGADNFTDEPLPEGHYLTHVSMVTDKSSRPVRGAVNLKVGGQFSFLLGGWIRGLGTPNLGAVDAKMRIRIPANAQLRTTIRNDTGTATITITTVYTVEAPGEFGSSHQEPDMEEEV